MGGEPPAQPLAEEGDELGGVGVDVGDVGEGHPVLARLDVPFQDSRQFQFDVAILPVEAATRR